MYPGGPGHLGQAGQVLFHVPGGDQHQVGQLVNDDDHVGQPFFRIFFRSPLFFLQQPLIVGIDIPRPFVGHFLVTVFHLPDGPT